MGDKTVPCWSASACADTKALIAGYVMLLAAAMPPASHINLQRPAVVKFITGTQRAGQGQHRHTAGQSRSTLAHSRPVKVNTGTQRASQGQHRPTTGQSMSTPTHSGQVMVSTSPQRASEGQQRPVKVDITPHTHSDYSRLQQQLTIRPAKLRQQSMPHATQRTEPVCLLRQQSVPHATQRTIVVSRIRISSVGAFQTRVRR